MKESSISNFKDLQVWQKARLLVKTVYQLTQTFPKEEQYGLTAQIRRAAISIMSKAEGSSKRSTKEFIRFIHMAYGSLAELEAQIIVAQDLDYVTPAKMQSAIDAIAEIGRMLNALKTGLLKKLNSELSNSYTLPEEAEA